MKEIRIESVVTIFDTIKELPTNIQILMSRAVEARNNAYSPYSNFSVGAAVLLENNEIVTGSNQENASYPSGLCAERTAVFYAGAKYPNVGMKALAITASSSKEITRQPIPPCGACRQVLAEYEEKQDYPFEIYFMGAEGPVAKSDSLANLLPFVFKGSML